MGNEYDLNVGRTQSDLRIFARNSWWACLRVPAIGSFRKKKKTGKNAGFLRKRLVIVDLFERLVVGGMFSPLVPVVRP